MRTQSIDTHPDAERVQIAIMRSFTPARKFQSVASLTDTLAKSGQAFRESPAKRVAVQYGGAWASRFATYTRAHPHVPVLAPDLCAALLNVIEPLERRHIPFALAGRLACGIYGLPSTVDVIELVVDHPRHVRISHAHTRMGDAYLDVRHQVRVAIQHAPLLLQRSRALVLLAGHAPISIVAPEDLALELLRRFDATGRRDDALYNDLLGMLKVQAPGLDIAAMWQQAALHELLTIAFADAGIAA